jgi:hypothetical protein
MLVQLTFNIGNLSLSLSLSLTASSWFRTKNVCSRNAYRRLAAVVNNLIKKEILV